MDNIKKRIKEALDEKMELFESISDYIFRNPELGGEERKAAALLTETLQAEGFAVSFPFEDLPTAFIAEYNTGGGCTVAFLPEYDALPGYGEKGEGGHACGHNWIAAAMCGCGIVLSKAAAAAGCNVKVIGCPAEETFGAKYDLCRRGVFDDVDIVMQAHLAEVTCLETRTLAMNSMEFVYRGKAAHAAQFPDQGINALEAVLQMFSGVNGLRQHVRPDARIHGIITHGGQAANIIPDYAACRFSFRADDRAYLEELREKIVNIAEGAALMTGAKLEYDFYENPYDDMVNNSALIAAVQDNLKQAGISGFIPGEMYLNPGSSDIGNVSQICPTVYFEVDPEGDHLCIVHDDSALEIVNSEAAYRKMRQVIGGFAAAAAEIALKPELLENIRRCFERGCSGTADRQKGRQ